MKTIRKQEEVAFNAISFRDAIVALPLMDALANAVNYNKQVALYLSLPREEQKQYSSLWMKGKIEIPADSIDKIYALLTQLGFESQVDIKEPTLEDLQKKV